MLFPWGIAPEQRYMAQPEASVISRNLNNLQKNTAETYPSQSSQVLDDLAVLKELSGSPDSLSQSSVGEENSTTAYSCFSQALVHFSVAQKSSRPLNYQAERQIDLNSTCGSEREHSYDRSFAATSTFANHAELTANGDNISATHCGTNVYPPHRAE